MKYSKMMIMGFLLMAAWGIPLSVSANAITTLHSFNGTDGGRPVGRPVFSGDGTTLYGTTTNLEGGSGGTLFSMDLINGNFNLLHTFLDLGDGVFPVGTMTLSGDTFYGMTIWGGAANNGAIFSIQDHATDDSTFSSIYSFQSVNGVFPVGSLTLSNGKLYGMTTLGSSNRIGEIFSINADATNVSTGFSVINSFNGLGGAIPAGGLTLSPDGTKLYGMTALGGASRNGTIFSINATAVDNSTFSSIYSFSGNDGFGPVGSLTSAGSRLYGVTVEGGNSNNGTVFSINAIATAQSSGFSTILSFNGANGLVPEGCLTLAGSKLFGVTVGGGDYNYGTIFSINLAAVGHHSTNFTVEHSFNGNDGAGPVGGLTLSPDGSTLYGMTAEGGYYDYGTIFAFPVYSNPEPGPAPPVELFVSPINQNVSDNAGTTSFTVTNAGIVGTVPWTASVTGGGDWLSITSGFSGINSGTITCAYTANPVTAGYRTGYIRVAANDGSGSVADVSVTQCPPVPTSTLLWTDIHGTAWVWTLDGAATLISTVPYVNSPGSTAVRYHQNSDGTAQMLWDNADGSATIWELNSLSDPVILNYGPISDPAGEWTAVDYHMNSDGTANMLWVRTDGYSMIWTLDGRGNKVGSVTYSTYTDPDGDFLPRSFCRNSDGTANMLWVRPDGFTLVWTLASDGSWISTKPFSPYVDPVGNFMPGSYRLHSDGTANMFWVRPDGFALVWTLDSTWDWISTTPFGPDTAMTPVDFERMDY